jgi:excisionase family DNA binding protein
MTEQPAKSSVDEFLTVARVAAILKLNQQTVRNWIDSGFLPAVRVGRRVRIRRVDFDQLLERSYSGTTAKHEPIASIWDGKMPAPVLPPGGSVGDSEADR